MRDTPKAPFLQEIGNTDSNQVVCGIQAPPEVIWMCLPTSLKTYPPKQVALSQNGAFPGYYRWVWYNRSSKRSLGSRSDCVATVASTDAAFSAHRCRVDMRVACDDLGCAVASSLPFSDPIAARSNDLGSHFFSEPISPARTPRSPTSRDQTCESSPTPPPTMAGMAWNTRQVCWQQCSISQWSLDTTRPPPTRA